MPARGPEISVKISAKADQFSASVAQIKKDLAALPGIANQATQKLGSQGGGGFSVGRLTQQIEAQVGRAYGGAAGLASRGAGAISSVTRGIPGFGALAGAASIAGLGEMVSHFASAGVELRNTSRLAGTSAEGLNSLRGAARLIGLSAGDADGAMLGLNRTLQDATFGRNAAAAATFQQLGVSFGDMAHGARTAGEVLPEIVDKITDLAKIDPRRAARLLDLVGIPSSALPLLMRGREALAAQRTEVERLYGNFDNYQQASERFTAAQARMGMASERLGMSIMTALEPALTPMLTKLGNFVDEHKTDISDTFRRIGEAAEGSGARIARVAENLRTFINIVQTPGRWYTDWLQTQGTPQQQADRYGDAYRRVMPPEADNRSAWQRIAPYWAGGTDAPTSRIRPTQRPSGQLPSGPLGGWENGVPPSDDRNAPRGIRNNNPLNLEYRGQQGAIGTDGRFGRYGDMRDGIGAGLRQLLMYQERDGLQTVAAMINRWAPPSENDTNSYARRVASAMGVDPNTAVNLRDPEAAARMVNAMSQVENGRAVDPRLVRQGVNRVLGRPDDDGVAGAIPGSSRLAPTVPAFANQGNESQPARSPSLTERLRLPMNDDLLAGSKPPSNDGQSTVRIEIDHSGVPPGVTMNPSVKGDGVELGDIRVRRAMPQAGNTGPFNSFAGP